MRLETDDISFPEDGVLMEAGDVALARIAPSGRPAKVGRPQPAEFERGMMVSSRTLVVRARRHKRRKLDTRTGAEFARNWKRGAERRGLAHLGTTPHGARAAVATEAPHRGMSDP